MVYSEKLAYYRTQFKRHLEARDAANAKLYAILYGKLVREICGQINSYADRAQLAAEADKYDIFAAMITKYGITDAVKKAILSGETKVPHAPSTSDTKKAAKPTTPPIASKPFVTPAPPVSTPSVPATPPPVRSDSTGEDIDWGANLFERYVPATLVVQTGIGVGTGFFITSDGYFITNHHVVHEGSKLSSYIRIESGDGKISCAAEFIKADKKLDVALLRVKNYSGKTPYIPIIKDYSQVRPGIAMVLIGNGLNFGLAPTAGNVKYAHSISDDDLVYTAPSNNGDSGAPVFNREGECIGIHKSSTVAQIVGSTRINTTGLSNATTAENIRKLLNKWGLEGKV